MEDFTELLARQPKTGSNSEAPVFKKPVIIGKRPGKLPTKSSGTTTVQNLNDKSAPEDSNSGVAAEEPRLTSDSSDAKEKVEVKAENVQINSNKAPKAAAKSPAELEREKQIPLPYKEPQWSGVCREKYNMEVLKSGVIVTNVDLTTKPFYVLGRLSHCDVVLEHPSISRFHAVLQYRGSEVQNSEEKGWYLFDLGSTHGTFLNKQQVQPKTYCRIRAGHVFKLGVSTRMFILQGPPDDEEPESELTVTQLKELRLKREAIMNELEDDEGEKRTTASKPETSSVSDGIDWGMGEDAHDENPQSENPFALDADGALNEDLYLEDPKKTLRGWFEREGYELEYKVVSACKVHAVYRTLIEHTPFFCLQVEEKSYANFVCRVELPIETSSGAAVMAEANVKGGKKKEAVVQCALEACRILDRHGLLRQSTHEAKRQRKKRFNDEDYYSSDEDTFLDRTGAVERKRQARMISAGKATDSVETYESLVIISIIILGNIRFVLFLGRLLVHLLVKFEKKNLLILS
nr:EOG090X026V [Sida crystallina]